MRVMWERAIERGEIAADTDPEIAMDSLYGPLIFRLMSGHGPLSSICHPANCPQRFLGRCD